MADHAIRKVTNMRQVRSSGGFTIVEMESPTGESAINYGGMSRLDSLHNQFLAAKIDISIADTCIGPARNLDKEQEGVMEVVKDYTRRQRPGFVRRVGESSG